MMFLGPKPYAFHMGWCIGIAQRGLLNKSVRTDINRAETFNKYDTTQIYPAGAITPD